MNKETGSTFARNNPQICFPNQQSQILQQISGVERKFLNIIMTDVVNLVFTMPRINIFDNICLLLQVIYQVIKLQKVF